MSLPQRIISGNLHRNEHIESKGDITKDPACSTCYPPTNPPEEFERFWSYYSRYLAPTATDYSEITIQRFLQADLVRQTADERGYITLATTTILKQYLRVLQTIHYRANLRTTLSDLTVQVVLTALITENFKNDPTSLASIQVINLQNPVTREHPKYLLIQQILQAYQNQERQTRTSGDIVPDVPPLRTESRPETPLEIFDTDSEPGSTVSQDSATRQNTLLNQINQGIDQLQQRNFGYTEDDFNRFEQELRDQQPNLVPLPESESEQGSEFELAPDDNEAFIMANRIFKPDPFCGKAEEDAEAWLAHFEKVARANNWDEAAKLRIVPVFLKETAERWWNRAGENFNAWENDPTDQNAVGFTDGFLQYFVNETKKARWQDQFDSISQGRRSIEEFNEDFLRKWKKADPEAELPEGHIVRKYIRALKTDIGAHVYTHPLDSLEQAMEVAERYVRGQELTKGNNANYLEEIEDLKHQVNMLKLGLERPEVIEVQAVGNPVPPLNKPLLQTQTYPQQFVQNPQYTQGQQGWNNQRNQNSNARRNNNNNNRQRNRSRTQWDGQKEQLYREGKCFRCQGYGHIARNCPNQRNNDQGNANIRNNQGNNRRNNQDQGQPQVNNLDLHLLSTPPQKPYDIVPDVWNAPAHATIGELLSNQGYRKDLQTALNTIDNRDVLSIDPVTTTALKMNIRLGNQRIKAIPDSGAALSIITTTLQKKLNLNYTPIAGQNVQALNSEARVIGVMEDTPIKIGQIIMKMNLRVVESPKDTLLLGMDWYQKYEVTLNTPKRMIEFTVEGTRYQTPIEFEQEETIFMLEEIELLEERPLRAD